MGKTVAKIITYVLVALVIVGAVGLIYKFTNGFNEDFKTFYVEHDGKQILTTDSKMTFESGQKYKFAVKYTFDKEDAEPKDYSVKIIPHIERDFDYTVDGEKYLYSKTGELTVGFNLTKNKTDFELDLPYELDLQKVLTSVHGGNAVTVPVDAEINNAKPYRLVIASYNGKVTYNIDFNVTRLTVTGVTLNPSEIVFGGGTTETPTQPSVPETPTQPREYNIGYLTGGDGTNLTNYSIDGPTSAKAGETVTFHVNIYDENYITTGFYIYAFGVSEKPEIKEVNGSYQFTMPTCNVDIRIDLEYTAVTDEPTYSLEYDSLGWASMEIVNMNCPDRAAAGETVTFTANIKPESAGEYKISGITVEFSSGESYIEDLQPVNGIYTFTMPDAATMEANGYLTLLFYIIPIDM